MKYLLLLISISIHEESWRYLDHYGRSCSECTSDYYLNGFTPLVDIRKIAAKPHNLFNVPILWYNGVTRAFYCFAGLCPQDSHTEVKWRVRQPVAIAERLWEIPLPAVWLCLWTDYLQRDSAALAACRYCGEIKTADNVFGRWMWRSIPCR